MVLEDKFMIPRISRNTNFLGTVGAVKTLHTGTALSNQNSRTFPRQFLVFQGLKITEGSAILTHIFPLYKAHVTA